MNASSFFSKRPKAAPVDKAQQEAKLPWVEKYRPKTVDEVAYQDEVTKTLKKSIETSNLPHLLFYGPPGTGKTSTILAIGRQLYGPNIFKDNILELNASDDRSIKVVRNRVKSFSQIVTSGKKEAGYPCPPYKLIILDEADSMTVDAQAALRRMMETYSKTTRFCLICNYVTRIIEPLASRCVKFRFKPLSKATMLKRLQEIAANENCSASPDSLDALVAVSGGDMRRSITLMQSAHQLEPEGFTAQTIIEISGQVQDTVIDQFVQACQSNSFEKLQEQANNVICEGYSTVTFIQQLQARIVVDQKLTDLQKAAMTIKMAEVDAALTEGAGEFLQLLDLGSVMLQAYCKSN